MILAPLFPVTQKRPARRSARAACLTTLLLPFLFFLPALAPNALAELPETVVRTLQRAGIPLADVGVVVRPLDGSPALIEHNAGQAMNPASVMKLLTTYAALDLLGPAHQWETLVLAGREPVAGVLTGNLYLVGSGDPQLTSDQLWFLLRRLRVRGIERIAGDIVLDRSAFAVTAYDPADFDAKPQRAYNVGPNALLLDFQALRFTVQPDPVQPHIALESPSARTVIDNALRNSDGPCPGDWRDRIRLAVLPADAGRRIEVRGTYAARCGERALNLAPLSADQHADGLIRALWQELGGRLDGRVRSGTAPADAVLLDRHKSPPLADIVRDINKYSNNVMARQLFLTLGGGDSPANTEAAVRRIEAWLATRGLRFPELTLENGSGLSRRERISTAHLVMLLVDAWQHPLMPEFIASLPLAGVDGTMKKRLVDRPAAGLAHIKTGTLDGVRTAAGYAQDAAGRRYALAFLINDARADDGGSAMDALLDWLAERR